MPNHILLSEIDLSPDELQHELDAAFGPLSEEWLPPDNQNYKENSLLTGRVVRVTSDAVWVDVGYKSEGAIDLQEWADGRDGPIVSPRPGDRVRLLLLELEDESGTIRLSYHRARLLAEWEEFLSQHKEGDIVTGPVTRKIKGGLLVHVGVNAFLPASQVDVRRPRDLGDYLGQTIECKIVQIDKGRRNVVVSRRELLEEQRERLKQQVLAELEPGQIRKGVVKNLTTFGAFVDLGGVEGLLHISDMSWGRVNDPRDVVQFDQELDIFVLRVERDKGRIALSLKHLIPSPWEHVTEKYPVGSEHEGEVVSLTGYGAFVALAPGLEGLIHVSQMSRGRRILPPSELVQVGDPVTCVVLNIDLERKRLSLALKRTESDPWEGVLDRYHIGQTKKGKVTKLTGFGAFVELEPGLEGLVHISELADSRVEKAEDVVQVGEEVDVKILRIDAEKRKIGLSRRGLTDDGESVESEGEGPSERGRPRTRELRGGTGTSAGLGLVAPPDGETV